VNAMSVIVKSAIANAIKKMMRRYKEYQCD
jgi:hypothetical protein